MPIPPSQLRAQENCSLFMHWKDSAYVEAGPGQRRILAVCKLAFPWEAKNCWFQGLLPSFPKTYELGWGVWRNMPITFPSSGIALVLLKTLHPHGDSLTLQAIAVKLVLAWCCHVVPPFLHRKDLQRRLHQAPEICQEGKTHVSHVNAKQQNIRP